MRRISLIIHAVVLAAFGLSLLLIPTLYMSFYGAETTPGTIPYLNVLGVVMLGNAILSWLASRDPYSDLADTILLILFFDWLVAIIPALVGQFSGAFNTLGWLTVGLTVFWAVVFGYLRFAAREESVAAGGFGSS